MGSEMCIRDSYHSQAIHKLWLQVKKYGQAPKMGTTALTDISADTEADPLPHNRTLERPSPPPRSMIKKKVTLALEGPRGTQYIDPGQQRGHPQPVTPPKTRTPQSTKTYWGHNDKSVEKQPPDEPRPSKKLAKMQCTSQEKKRSEGKKPRKNSTMDESRYRYGSTMWQVFHFSQTWEA